MLIEKVMAAKQAKIRLYPTHTNRASERTHRADAVVAAWFLVLFAVGLCLVYWAMNCASVTTIHC